ncbi:MAG: nucleotidyl transferase AbiEii/AbiGii toxin family protein [Bacteroidota bacterium]
MLHYETIDPQTLQLLRTLQNIDDLNDSLLVGGTALALQLGHRISIDLDLFSSII